MNLRLKIVRIILRLFFPRSEAEKELIYLKEAYHFWKLTSLYNASHHTDDDIEKMQYTLLRENHVIEKGMSMRNPRYGFGQEKVINLLERLNKYFDLYGSINKDFLRYPLSTIRTYISYTESKGVNIDHIVNEFDKLMKKTSLEDITIHSGVMNMQKCDVLDNCKKDFRRLLQSRHSIRYFSEEPVSRDLILDALRLASLTPSACNRQGWKTYVFEKDKSVELMRWQSGCRGFENELRYSILVTANLKAFLSHEVHQAYVDGGLYAMNLINALHSLGLGTIPLSCGFNYQHLRELKRYEIPENEVPIVIVAFGHLLDEFNVAVSTRKDVSLTNTFHQ